MVAPLIVFFFGFVGICGVFWYGLMVFFFFFFKCGFTFGLMVQWWCWDI